MASPPHIPQISIPRKRSSISSISSVAKKRKPSTLRHTFDPNEPSTGSPLAYDRSPSVDSVATGSLANGASGKKRKRKDADAQSATGSSIRGSRRGAVDDATTVAGGDPGEAMEPEEEEDYDDIDDDNVVAENGDEAAREQEKEHERILMLAMSADQQDRYAAYRRVRVRSAFVRRLVNQTLSQSVPAPVVIAVSSYTKAFIGEIVDRALTVRDEWAAARAHRPNPNVDARVLAAGLQEPFGHRPGAKPTNAHISTSGLHPNQIDRELSYWVEVDENVPLDERTKESDKGPLTPAHLREALRRYKRDRDGGGAGFAGMSLEGVERTMGRTGGKRLFR